MPLDVVIPYKQSFSNELIYTLRSLKNIPHRNVFIVGDKTRLKVNHIPYIQTANIAINTLNIINLAVESEEVSSSFIYLHDDMYTLRPIKSIPIHHRGLYRDIVQEYQEAGKNTFYTKRMQTTYTRLLSMGIKDPLCYELHIPFVINKAKWLKFASHITPDVNKLSMYGNLNEIGGTKINDVKVRRGGYCNNDMFVSTHDGSFNNSEVGRAIRTMFNEKSPYEW